MIIPNTEHYNRFTIIIKYLMEVIYLEIDYSEIGGRVLSRRKELKLTQEDLSKLTEISINQISNIENGHSVPTVDTIVKLSRALKTTPDYFLLGAAKSIDGATINRIAEKAMLGNDKQQNLIYEIISVLLKEDNK